MSEGIGAALDHDMIAVPIEEYVWCDVCGEPHAFDAEDMTLSISPVGDPTDECAMIEPVQVGVSLPKDWERDYVACYAADGKGYDLYPKSPPLLDCHHEMVYFEPAAEPKKRVAVKPLPYEWRWPGDRSTVTHLFWRGPGTGDSSLCGVTLKPDHAPAIYEGEPRCKRCENKLSAEDAE